MAQTLIVEEELAKKIGAEDARKILAVEKTLEGLAEDWSVRVLATAAKVTEEVAAEACEWADNKLGSRSGGVKFGPGSTVSVKGSVVGRDKVVVIVPPAE